MAICGYRPINATELQSLINKYIMIFESNGDEKIIQLLKQFVVHETYTYFLLRATSESLPSA